MIDTLSVFPFLKEKYLALNKNYLFILQKAVIFLNLLIAYSGGKAMQLNYLCGHLVQPFSTAAERVFSLLNSSITDR